MAGESKAKVIPLHSNSGRSTAARRAAAQRVDGARRHPSLLADPNNHASAEQIAAVVREIDQHRGAAAGMPAKPKAVFAAYPTITKPPAEQPAASLSVPGLILTDPGDPMSLRSNAVELARAWRTATLRATSDTKSGGLVEGRRLAPVVGLPGANRSTQKIVRALMTGYLLHTLAGDKEYKDFTDAEVELPKAPVLDPFAGDPVDLENKVVALLKP